MKKKRNRSFTFSIKPLIANNNANLSRFIVTFYDDINTISLVKN